MPRSVSAARDMPKRKAVPSTEELSETQQKLLATLIDMGMDKDKSREVVIFTDDVEEAILCLDDGERFKQLKQAFSDAKIVGNKRDGLRADGARTAAARLARWVRACRSARWRGHWRVR